MDAEIIYTPANDTLKIPFDLEWSTLKEFDLNGDGTLDTRIEWNNLDYSFQFSEFPEALGDGPGYIYTWELESYYGYTIPVAVSILNGEMIDETAEYYHPNIATEYDGVDDVDYYLTCIDYFAFSEEDEELFHWPLTDHYIGVKFEVDGNWHYGWIQVQRVKIEEDGYISDALVIKGFASESTPDTPIEAGKTSNGDGANINENTELHVNVYPNPFSDKITIEGLPDGSSSISIFSIEGRLVKRINNLDSNNIEIDLSNFDPGVFIIEIQDLEKHLISKKKIVKQ